MPVIPIYPSGILAPLSLEESLFVLGLSVTFTRQHTPPIPVETFPRSTNQIPRSLPSGLRAGTEHKPGPSALLEPLRKLLEETFHVTAFSSLKNNSVRLGVTIFITAEDIANVDDSRVKRWRKRSPIMQFCFLFVNQQFFNIE